MENKKLIETARRLSTFFKVIQKIVGIAIIAAACVLIVLTIADAVNPESEISTGLNVIDIGPLSIELAEENELDNTHILIYAWIYSGLAVICAALIYLGLGYVRKILAPMAEGSPFHTQTSRYIRKLAILSLIMGVVQNVEKAIEAFTALHLSGLDKLADSEMIRSVKVNYGLELDALIMFFILLLMSYVFEYGAQLQKLSDETL